MLAAIPELVAGVPAPPQPPWNVSHPKFLSGRDRRWRSSGGVASGATIKVDGLGVLESGGALSGTTTVSSGGTIELAYHFAFPGIGHVAKQGDGFRYHPEAMVLTAN